MAWTDARLPLALAAAAALLGAGATPALAITATAKPPVATEGAGAAGTVASFTDGFTAVLGCTPAAQYSAAITWGDGTTTPGTVNGGVGMLFGGCLYAIDGSHTYGEEGPVSYSVAIAGPASSGDTGPAPLLVHDAPLLNAAAARFAATQGTPAAATVATFSDANPGAQASEFTATIAWGDGTSGAGAVAAAPGGGFAVTASHTYAHSGDFTVFVTIRDAGGSQASAASGAAVTSASSGTPPGGKPGTPPPAPLRLGLSAPVLARGGTVVVAVRCPVAAKLCRGRLTVATLASARSRVPALRRAQALGSTLFLIPGGRRAQLSVRPKRSLLAVLRQAGTVTVAAYTSSFDAATGRSQVASLTAALKLG